MIRVVGQFCEWHLVRAPVTFGLLAIDLLGAGPAFGGTQNDHRPARALAGAFAARGLLNRVDLGDHRIQSSRHELMHPPGLGSLDEIGPVAIADEQALQLLPRDARQHGGIGDLVAVQMQDWQHGTVAHGVEKFVGMPSGGEWPGLGLAVADHAGGDEIRVIEHRAKRMRQRVAQFTAFVNRARRLRRNMARYAARERELPEQLFHAFRVLGNIRIDLAVTALQPGVRDQPRTAVSRACDVNDVQIMRLDHPVQVCINEIQPRGGPPMSEQPRLDVRQGQWRGEQGIVPQIDLPHRQVVGRPPVGIHPVQFICRKWGQLDSGFWVLHLQLFFVALGLRLLFHDRLLYPRRKSECLRCARPSRSRTAPRRRLTDMSASPSDTWNLREELLLLKRRMRMIGSSACRRRWYSDASCGGC